MAKGKVYLVGAGPGEPDLITLRGLEVLRQAEVVIYDYLVDRSLLEEAKEDAELICCDDFDKKRYSDGFLIHQGKINNLIVKKAKQGKKVIRLKNGDPSIFSRLSQELDVLIKNKIEFEIVPGVTAASAVSCFSGIPLTDRRYASSCVFVTGHEDSTKEKSLLDWGSITKQGTIVLYMAVESLPKIVQELIKRGKTFHTPVAVIQDVSLITQKMVKGTLKDIVKKTKEKGIRPPAIVIIGEIVKLERKFNWLKKNKKILFTGISPKRYFERGFISHLPLVKIEPLDDYTEFDNTLRKICHKLSTINYKLNFDWIVFSSRYGVKYFFERLNKIGSDTRDLKGIKIATIGNSTRNRLLDFGVKADLVPQKESSQGLIEEFKKIDLKGKKVFLPHSNLSDKGLAKGLKSYGAEVVSCIAYKNVMPKGLPHLDLNFFDEIMFTSPSGVRNFIKRYKRLPPKIKVRCIGEVTKKEVERFRDKLKCRD